MDTRPKHVPAAQLKGVVEEGSSPRKGKPCSRESRSVARRDGDNLFRQPRKPDDGDATAHRGGGLTPHGGSFHKRGARGCPPSPPGSAGRQESFMNHAG